MDTNAPRFYTEDELWGMFAAHLVDRVKDGEAIGIQMEYATETMYGHANFSNSILIALRDQSVNHPELTITIQNGGISLAIDPAWRLLR